MPQLLRMRNPGRVPGKNIPQFNFGNLTPTLTRRAQTTYGLSVYSNAYGYQRQNTWIAQWQKKYNQVDQNDLNYVITWSKP
jgi:hypothetical protein